MRSSDMLLLVKRFAAWSGIFLAACSVSPTPNQSAAPTLAAVSCSATNGPATAQDSATMAELRQSVENGPLYTVPAAATGVASCHVHYDSGVTVLEYRFKDGGWLSVKRDARIEYTEQEARFALSPAENPATILADAERVAFGSKGCGIDWRQAETQPAGDDHNAIETIFRGDVCNCQARIRRDAAGRIVGFMLRSAC
jgi:hypothetical protein